MNVPEKILVTMTSWHKRIDNVAPVVKTLLNQTIKPNKILLNFCTEDFPNMEGDLPNDLLELVKENDCIEIYWFIENYKAWKKHLHAIEIADDNTLIICTDDDHLYPEYFIEWLYVSYCYYGKKNPVTLNTTLVCHNLWSFNGPGTLYRKSDWKDYKKYLNQYNVIHIDISSFWDFYKDNIVEKIIEYICEEIREIYGDKLDYSKMINATLMSVYRISNIPFVIIIDEWDYCQLET